MRFPVLGNKNEKYVEAHFQNVFWFLIIFGGLGAILGMLFAGGLGLFGFGTAMLTKVYEPLMITGAFIGGISGIVVGFMTLDKKL